MPFLGELFSVLAALFWGIAVILFKKCGESMSPLALNLFKNWVSVILLFPTMLAFGESPFPDVPLESWVLLSLSGILGVAVADTLFFISLEKLGAGLTAVVDTSYTPFMLGLSYFFLGERVSWLVLAGALLIMSALVVGSLSPPAPGRTRRDIAVGAAIGIVGILLMAVAVVMIKGVLDRSPVVWAAWVRMLAAALALVPMIALRRDHRSHFAVLRPTRSWRYALPAAVVGSYLAMITWIAGMKLAMVSVAALLNQLSTIFIFVFATLFLKERLTTRRGVAIFLAFLGAVLVSYR